MNDYIPIEFLVLPLIAAVVIVAMCVLYLERSRREKHRVELQKAILERVGSVKDFAEFLTTEQGERFLRSLAPAQFTSPKRRSLTAVKFGINVLTVGLFLNVALHSNFFGSFGEKTPPRPLLMGALLLVATGTGLLLSAAVSFVIARALGVNGHSRSKKDDAA